MIRKERRMPITDHEGFHQKDEDMEAAPSRRALKNGDQTKFGISE